MSEPFGVLYSQRGQPNQPPDLHKDGFSPEGVLPGFQISGSGFWYIDVNRGVIEAKKRSFGTAFLIVSLPVPDHYPRPRRGNSLFLSRLKKEDKTGPVSNERIEKPFAIVCKLVNILEIKLYFVIIPIAPQSLRRRCCTGLAHK